jgi:Holliday junction resolvase
MVAARRPMTEAQLQGAVMELARLLGWKSFHVWISIRSNPGFPDIVACRGERLLAIELKSRIGKVSAAQEEWLSALAAAGAETYVWRPADWLDGTIERVLR